ncbi:glycoside hydrolase family 26 protein [Streptomyces sp. NPDC006879]|uniref:glycoside hydrolase family 26 protein n=1 Tax=Streptomyces sp. NPDC006879 TaxID=3364767 RepID=UPI0036B0BDCE
MVAFPRRILAGTCIGTVTAGLLATGAALAAAEGDPAPGPGALPVLTSDVPMGAYLHYGQQGVARIPQLSRWLGGRDMRVGHTYLPGDLWVNIEGRSGFIESWARWRQEQEDRILVLNVPMQERNENRVSDAQVRQLIREGARGRFDQHFKKLAQRLVDLGVPDTVIVLGWEMNGLTYTHRCGPDPENWKAYWKRVVTTMRSVPGQEFRFDFTANRGTDAIAWTRCYPGDDFVDIIGLDSYDQPPGTTFDDQVTQPYGLQHHVDFAKEHGKPISFPEWGLWRRGDNPEYMRRMLQWIDRHEPVYHTITDYCPHGVWQCGSNPRSAQVFRAMLYGKPTPKPTPTIPPVPTPTIPPIPTPTIPPIPTPTIPPVPTPTIPPVPTVPPRPTHTPTATPSPTTTASPSPTVAPSPTATASPSPTEPPAPTPPPAPPAEPPNSMSWCVPLGLGDWLENLIGRREVCVRFSWGDRWPF